MELVQHLTDNAKPVDNINISEMMRGGPKKSVVKLIDHNTGEVLGEYHNKVTIAGAQRNACYVFGLDEVLSLPTYNVDMNLDNTESLSPLNDPVICLFCISDGGCGSTAKDIKVSSYTDRIKPPPANPESTEEFTSEMMMPFRYVDVDDDISDDLRNYYFGRKTFSNLGKVGYYFKKFDTDPQLHLEYADGTNISAEVYNIESEQIAECYVEMRLRITRLDFRDYFENAIGWENARISQLSLCTGWYDDTIDQYVWYQDIEPYSLLNFSFRPLSDLTSAIDIIYSIYF